MKTDFFKVGMIYKKAGMVEQSVKYLELMMSRQKEQSNILKVPISAYIALAEGYLKQFRCYDARPILAKIKDLRIRGRGQSAKIAELSDACESMIQTWEGRKSRMMDVLNNAEKDYGGKLESGYFYFRTKDYERAENAYMKAISECETRNADTKSDLRNPAPELSAAYYGLAHTHLAVNDPERAVDALEKAIEAEPDNYLFYRDLGFIAFQNNNISSAELFFTKAVELSPQAIELYKPLADIYIASDDLEKAVKLYEHALLANPENPIIQKDLVTLYKDMISKAGRYGTA